jgi:hypothetical protein
VFQPKKNSRRNAVNKLNCDSKIIQTHERALAAAEKYKASEIDLLDAISEVRKLKVYRHFNCATLFEYCVKILKLEPGVVYGFTAVAKKSEEVPELKYKIAMGSFNVAKAKRITAVINSQNASHWIEQAQNLSTQKLEKAVATANPKLEVPARATYLSSRRVRLELALNEKLMLKIRRIQDLESQRRQTLTDLEDTLEAMADAYLTKHDPIERAQRAKIRGKLANASDAAKVEGANENANSAANMNIMRSNTNSSLGKNSRPSTNTKRTPIPAHIKHQVILRDKNKCQHHDQYKNDKCGNRRFLEIHHKIPVSDGGENSLNNLVTLCSGHHQLQHGG